MTWSAGINEIVSKYEPQSELSDNTVFGLNSGCDTITRTAGTPIFVDPINGSASWSGTINCPKNNLSQAVSAAISGDEIILQSGNYRDNVTVDNLDDLLIRAADGAKVVFDGTRSIGEDFNATWSAADGNGIQEVDLPQAGWQLFYNYDEQVPARWPNAQFSDETVFNRSYWAEGTLTSNNNAYTQGWLTDAGPEAGVHSGLNETINATGLDPVGAIAILNLGSFRSNSREITGWNSANGTFSYDSSGVSWKNKHHAYFLEGKRELIDVDGEWWFDNANSRLHYKTPGGLDANNLDLRVKVQPFAISVDNSDRVTIQGIDFFGTTVNFNNCDRCSFTNSTLEYPSTSKRGLGIAGESEDDRWMTRFYRCTNTFVDRISITNTDGGALEFHGSGGQSNNNIVNNSYFHAIDWTAADQKGLMTTIYEGGRDMYFTNNSVHLTGASSVLSIGDAPKVFYNDVWNVGYLQSDGAVVQVMQGEAPGAEIAYNWIHDIIKYGARFDAPIGQAGEGRNGTMHHNVIWNAAGGLMVKGDYHNINNNTVFNSSGKNDMIILTDNGVNNGNSTIHRNAADKMADHRSDSWSLYPLPAGTYWNNWNGYVNTTDSVWNQLVDPANRDFRPKVNSHLDNMSAGAYDAGVTNPWTAGVSWSYSPMSNPISGCMDSIAINYNSNAVFSDGSCIYTTLTSSPSTLSLGVNLAMTPHTLTYSTPFLADDKQTAASSGSVGAGTNIALDSNGAVHICSKTLTTDNLYYTTNASGSWQSATLDSSGNLGGDCFIILDSDDDIHITYRDDSNDNLKYATKALSSAIAASNWAISTMDNNGNVGNFGSMAVDANDRLHVAYYSSYDSCLKYATKDDGSSTWSREVVESAGVVGKFTSIALDSNGKPHITYRDTSNTNLKYAHKMGLSWVTATIDSTPLSGSGTSLAIDSNDHLHVAYKTNSTEIAYMTNRSGSWVKTTLDANTTGNWGVNYINLMLDEGDDPHVVYSDTVDHDIFYMSNTRGVWERVHVAGDSISKTSDAVMDENGGIHVAYLIDGLFDDIGYAAVRSLAHVPTFEIEPALPTGLSLDADTGTISGTPSQRIESTEYTVWANTTRTSAMTTLSITVDWALNRDLIPSVEGANLELNQAMSGISFNRPTPSFTTSTVDSSVNGANHVHAADMDGDGDLDIVAAAFTDNIISWYENDGAASPSWTTHDVVTNANGVRTIYVADIDNDGDLDIVAGLFGNKAITWYENNGAASSWTTHTVDTNSDGVVGVHVADLDADGYLDIIGAWEVDDEIKWYKNNGDGTSWTSAIVATPDGPHGLGVADMDNDGDLDIVAALVYADAIAWYSNDGNAASWTAANIDTTLDVTRNLYIGDLDGDNDLDVVSTSSGNNKITWHENSNNAQSWNNNIISTSEQSAYGVHIADIDGDGDLDIVSAVEGDNTIAMWENDGAVDPTWTEMIVSSSANGARNTFVADIDGDDDLDIVSALFSGNAVELYNTDWTNSPSALLTNADCGVSPDLPAGLSMEAGTCTITGTPTALSANETYTIYANYSSSSVQLTTTIYLEVEWGLIASVDYLETPRNSAITPITFNWTAWSSGVINSTSSVYTSGQSGDYNSIAVDSNDKVHIVFYRNDNSNLYHATNASGSWVISSIETNNNVGKYCSLAIDSNDGLHVSYQYNTGNALKYAYKASGSSTWSRTTVDGTGGKFTSIAVDSNDKPHIAYRDSGGDVGYAEKTGSSWAYGFVQTAGDIASTSIAIDSDDHIHIAYYDSSNEDMYHLTDTSGSWVRTFVEDIGWNAAGMSTDIAIDPTTDQPGISYLDASATALGYTYYTGSTWSSAVVENGGDYGRYNSIAYDSLGNVHISHERNSADDLYYTSDKTGSWVSTAIDTTNSVGLHTAIAVDSNDDIHIAYRLNTGYDVRHATVQGYKTGSVARTAVTGATCIISPALPSGLTLNQGDCSISGTPTVDTNNVTYTMTATSSTGLSKSGEFMLWVTLMAPDISYTGSPFVFNKDVAITDIVVTNNGDTSFWAVSPNLPTGLSIDSSGTISGTPTDISPTQVYMITATNSGGQSSTNITLTVVESPPSDLVYNPDDMIFTVNSAITTITPTYNGGTPTTWTHTGTLPTGLSFDSITGAISGTPIALLSRTQYTITATNSGGSATVDINITVNDVAPSISYPLNDITATLGVPINPHSNPTNTGGAVTSWEISPDPGPAFHFNQFNGVISGTPGILLIRTEYTIYANNSGGSSVAYVNVTINDVPPNTIIYSPHTMTLEKDTAMSPVTPTASGGSVSTWEIAPDLPSGLSFDSATGTISGTPTVLQLNSVAYTVWANNTGGSASTTVNIAINDQVATISYSTPVEISNDRALDSTITPTISGGAVTSWEISPSLPAGLIFGTTNGSIWGTPVGVESDESYTIWGNNSGGSAQATLTLTLVWTLTPTVEGVNATRNTTLADDIQWTWDYEPLEAQSISLDTGDYNTCSIRADSDIYCWGRNGNGQLGYGSSSDLGCGNHIDACKDRPRETIDLGSDVVSIAFGDRHACGLTDAGIVKCWGRNNHGQIGKSGGDKSSPEVVSFGSGLTATSIYAGGHHTCAILSDGSVKCWGRNAFGQLGIGTTVNTNTPTTVNTLGAGRSAISLALAWNSTCALLDDGSVKCWGKSEHGQLGDGSSTGQISSPPSNPISFGAGRTAKMITAGEFHYCAILDNDEIMCWGDGANGKLATGSTADQTTPTAPSGSFAAGRYAVYLDAGDHHTCAILDNGKATCWGSDATGQLGNGATTGDILSLHTGYLGWNAMAISAGGSHTCMQVDKPGDYNQHERIKCWGSKGSGQLGDDSNFASSNAVSPQPVWNGFTALNTGITAPNYVNGATCEISPSLPAGLTLTPGDCSITGTPTVTAVNTTYTVWANITGQSFSGQFYLEVGLNAPIISYSQSFYTFTIDATIAEIQPTNTGGEVTTWEIDPQSLPTGVNFGSANGTFWGTPTALETLSSHTVWANNSAGSVSFSIGFSVIDNPPIISYSETAITIVANAAMTPLPVINTGGAIVSCTASPSLPNGLSLSNTCEISGTPTAPSPLTPYTITATNTGGSDSTSISITVQNSGGTLTITPTNTEGSVNSTISDITMSYTHTASNYAWTSGVTTSTTTLTADWLADFGSNVYNGLELTHLLSTDIGPNGEQAIAFSRNVSSHWVLALMYEWNGVWTETIIDNNPNSAHHPSIAIDRFGALHIAYIDSDNDILRYATNASGQWVLTTLGSATYDNDDHRGTAIVIHPVTNAVHIVTSTNDNTYRDLVHHTNETGSWVNTTITNTLSDEGHDPSMAMDSDGNIYVAYYCDDGCSDLRMSSRINGVWQNETIAGNVASSGSNWNVGAQSDIAIDSQDTIHIVSNYVNNRRVYLHSGTPGSWTETELTSGSTSWWPTIAIDSNDVLHVAYHKEAPNRDLMYMTNASGSWSTPIAVDNNWGGWGSDMVIDQNDDLFIAHAGANVNGVIYDYLKVTTVQGTGQGLTPRPIFTISPPLPDGLNMNWRSGTITGTPTEVHTNTTHTVTVTALGLTTTATFTLLITGAPGDIAYSDISGSLQAPITPTTPTFTNTSTSGSISTWEIDPSLPVGMNFGSNNGTIWGTPTVVVSGDVFTIWANNSVGSKSTTVTVTIDDLSVSAINYAFENFTLTYYHTMTATTPSTTGGTATSWSIHPSLPTGLSLDAATGEISGRPEVLQTTAVTYTVWANNSGGTFSDQINITINDHSPAPINYLTDELNLVVNQSVVSVSDFEIRPDLLAAGEDHTCAIQSDGSVRCWGEGSYGRLGHGGGGDKNTPTATASLGAGRTAIDITAGSTHTCAVLDNGSVACWGQNNYGQLGDGTTTNRLTPTQTLSLGRPAVAVEAGSHFSTCALLDNGSVSCWGRNHKGQLGRGITNSTANQSQRTPALTLPMPGDLPVVALDISHYMVCGVLSDGSIACWGQYGGGNTPSLQTFFNSSNPAVDVSTGRYAGCGLLENGSVTCWGTGWLGTGGESQSANAGVIWPNLGSGRTAVQIEMGRKHRCVLLDDDSVKCWGDDQHGQLGNGAGQGSKNAPYTTSFSSNLGLQNMISGHWHTCIASKTNEIYCWGDGVNGKLGDGSTNHNQAPGKTMHFDSANPAKAHGDITSWEINASLPTGLTFGSNNGTIYGTATELWTQTSYTIWANNSGGSSVAYFNITVVDEVPTFSYSPDDITLTNNTASSDFPLAPTITGAGVITSWEINASLPSGVSFGSNNGTIYGTPTAWRQL